MKTLESAIECAAEHLPTGWKIRIDIENGYGGTTAIRPDESEVSMDTGDTCLDEQVSNALRLALDEEAADKLSTQEVSP